MPDSLRGNWPMVAIGGLVLLNLVLLTLLVLRQPAGAGTAEPAAAPGGSPVAHGSTSTSTATATDPTATPSARPTAMASKSTSDAERSTRLLAVNSDTLAWRAVFGPCPTEPELEVSRDGGRTWRRTTSGLKSVSRLRSFSESSVFAVGGVADCQARYVSTGGPGESWAPNQGLLDQTWYRVPTKVHHIHAPSGRVSAPCDKRLRDFAGLGDQGAAALCADGTVRTTQDGGRTWADLSGTSTGLALGADEQVYALAMRRDDCDGVAVTLLNPGADDIDSDLVQCATAGRGDSDEVAVGIRGQVMWLWLGDQIMVSTDRGRTWERADRS